VFADDLIVVEDDAGLAAVGAVRLEAVLAVVLQDVVRGDVAGADEDARATVVDDGVVLHRPVLAGVVVTVPSLIGAMKFRIVRYLMMTLRARWVKAYRFLRCPSMIAPGPPM
jgi:hypothetical protein